MGRKNDDREGLWLSPNADPRRLRDAENARKNRAEITAALSHGQISRRDLVKWGLFTSAGVIAHVGGLSPFAKASTASAFFDDGGECQAMPTGLPPSPTF